jgi:carboxyl-terminal processing protease
LAENRNKFNRVIIPLLVLMYLGIFTNGVLAYTPQSLYDYVWKLVNTKYVDQDNNGQEWGRWRHKYDSAIKTEEDAYIAIETMIASLNDPYTKFLNPEEFAEEGESIKGTLKGIGIQIGVRDGKLLIIAPIEDTPAQKAGLEANDEILEINGKSTKGMSVKDAADNIRGEEGTVVKLLVKRSSKEKLYSVERATIQLKSVSTTVPKTAKIDKNIGYIRLSSFLNKSASQEIMDALESMKAKDGYILDLRANPGGLLTNAIFISDMFLDGGVIVSTVDRDGYKETQRASKKFITDKPLVILINEGSASASEILSGALQDNDRAVLVGHKSFGKGLVQEINKLPGKSGINITTQKYLTPNGTDINKVGIVPDVIVDNSEADIKKKHDSQLEKANAVLQKLISSTKNASVQNQSVKIIKKPIEVIVR